MGWLSSEMGRNEAEALVWQIAIARGGRCFHRRALESTRISIVDSVSLDGQATVRRLRAYQGSVSVLLSAGVLLATVKASESSSARLGNMLIG